MAFTFVQSATNAATGAVSKAFTSAVTAGNMIVVSVVIDHSTDIIASIVDSLGNTYALAKLQGSAGSGYQGAIYHAFNILGGVNTVTVTPTTGTTHLNIAIHEYAVSGGTPSLDQTAGATGISTTPNSGSATTTDVNELIVGLLVANATVTPDASLTTRHDFTFNFWSYSVDKAAAVTGSYAVNGTMASNRWVALMATYLVTPTVVAPTLPDADSIAWAVLIEPQPAQQLGMFALESGVVWKAEWAEYESGIFRRLDEVRQNDTAYTVRTSIAAVQANPGSYYHDPSAGLIYLSTTSGANPETFAFIGAWFTLPLSTTRVQFDDQPLYYPLVTGALPSIVSEKPDPLFGATIADTGSVSLLNGDGMFDAMSQHWIWRNKIVTFKLGEVGADYSDYLTVGTMKVNNVQVDDEICVLNLETQGNILNKPMVSRTWGDGTITSFSNPAEGVLGLAQPVLFGYAADTAPAFVGTVGGPFEERYGLVDGLVQQASAVTVYAIERATGTRTTLTPFVDWLNSGDQIRIMNATYTNVDYEIRSDILDIESSHSDGCTFGTAARLLLTRAGETLSNIDSAAFNALDAAYPEFRIGLYVTDTAIPAADVLRQMEQSVNGQVYIGPDGLWTCRIWDASLPAAYTLTDADFAAWHVTNDLESSLNEVRVSRVTSWATGDVSEVSASNDTVRYGNETRDRTTVNSALTSDIQARVLANRLRFLRSHPPALIEFEERGLSLLGASVGDMVAIYRDRAPVARTGRYDGQLLELVRLEKVLSPIPLIRGTFEDLGGMADSIFRLAPSGSTLDWSTATDEEKAVYGFLSDSNGYLP